MKIKVCGMKHPNNIQELSQLPIDLMGMIFYPKSPRYVDELDLSSLPNNISRVGVFVNADLGFITETIETYSLNMVQLHGSESVDFCQQLNQKIPVMKAFSIADSVDIKQTADYNGACSYFLFDTKTPQFGGSGVKFDWSVLDDYQGTTPFLLSGGISPNDAQDILSICHPLLQGVDLNSRFEVEPGLKNIQLIDKFINSIRS